MENEFVITTAVMKRLGKNIEEYLNVFENVLIIPEELLPDEKEIREAIKTVKKLIIKLKKGDRSVFKDNEEWDLVEEE